MCPICNKNTMEDIVADYHGMLYHAFRVHEPYAIHAFVQHAREQMRAGRLSVFLHNKKYTKNVMTDMFGIGQRAKCSQSYETNRMRQFSLSTDYATEPNCVTFKYQANYT